MVAIERLPSPVRQAYQILLHSGLRLARWTELEGAAWTIPAARMKGKNSGKGQARPHAVPLTEPLQRIFAGVPGGEQGDFVWSAAKTLTGSR
jgi:hypothetical protein